MALALDLPVAQRDYTARVRGDDVPGADGAVLASVANAGSAGGTFDQATAGNRPTKRTNVLNGHAAIRLDGDDYLESSFGLTAIVDPDRYTLYVVARATTISYFSGAAYQNAGLLASNGAEFDLTHDGGVGTGWMADHYMTTGARASTPAIAPSPGYPGPEDWKVARQRLASNVLYLKVGATEVSVASPANLHAQTLAAKLRLGATYIPRNFIGDVPEFLFWDRVLSPAELLAVDGYITANYFAAAPTYPVRGASTAGSALRQFIDAAAAAPGFVGAWAAADVPSWAAYLAVTAAGPSAALAGFEAALPARWSAYLARVTAGLERVPSSASFRAFTFKAGTPASVDGNLRLPANARLDLSDAYAAGGLITADEEVKASARDSALFDEAAA